MKLSTSTIDKFKIMKLSGRIDWENVHLLDSKIKGIIDEGFCHIVFDLNKLTFICSGGIGTLIYNFSIVKKLDGMIYFISSNEYVDFIFETLKFNMLFSGCLFGSFEDFEKSILVNKNE